MRLPAFLDLLSKRAPLIVVLTLSASLVSSWMDAPAWLPNGLALIVGSFALLLFASRGRKHQLRSAQEADLPRSRGLIAHELAGNGTPGGHYVLGFFSIVTIVLTGIQSAYSMLAWAGFALGLVWGIVNANYPPDEEIEG